METKLLHTINTEMQVAGVRVLLLNLSSSRRSNWIQVAATNADTHLSSCPKLAGHRIKLIDLPLVHPLSPVRPRSDKMLKKK